jgi:hypothetical protein
MPVSKKSKTNYKQNDNITWGNFGKVYSYSQKKFIRLGTITAFNVIKNELTRNSLWFKAIKFMAKKNNSWSNKLKTLL